MTRGPDTIAAIATPPGRGGVAVIRVSGREARRIVAQLFRGKGERVFARPRHVYLGQLLDRPGGEALDQVLVFAMPGPRSYTGEDVVEIQCHGSSLVTQRILDSVLAAGARPAGPGEFTKRAFLSGRLDLAQAEAVADLIAARSEAGRRLAWSQLEGLLSARVTALREAVLHARAICEAAIDFPEDVPELTRGELEREIGRVRREVETMVTGFERARVRYEGARVALIGKPNVGKSSILNALVGSERAIVTPIPGTTRDVVEAAIALAKGPVMLADTAGMCAARDTVERLGVERSGAVLEDAACAVAVLDRARAIDAEDALVARVLAGKPFVVALNKCDLPAEVTRRDVAALVGDAPVVEVSALAGTGLDELTAVVERLVFDDEEERAEEEVAIFRARHRDAGRRALEDLVRAEEAVAAVAPAELVASDLTAAATALGAITGEVTTEEILDRVFAEFCIGK